MSDGRRAIAYADVSGKSVSGALMMMAAHEVLYSLAMSGHPPARLLDLANERLYRLGKRSFVALGMLSFDEHDPLVHYALAGQPQPLRRSNGEVTDCRRIVCPSVRCSPEPTKCRPRRCGRGKCCWPTRTA